MTRGWRVLIPHLARGLFLLVVIAPFGLEAAVVDTYDFGTCALYEQKHYLFEITNSGPETLEIISVEPSCSCVHVMQAPTQVWANSVGLLDILFAPDVLGSVEYRILVKTTRSPDPLLEYAIRGVVTGAVEAAKEPERSLYVDADEAARLVKNPELALWVDVRDEAAFSAAHIPGALNIPLYAVKTKAFLRNKKVVLVGYGFEGSQLEAEATKLKNLGFDTRIWYGGVRGWQRWGGKIEGSEATRLQWLERFAWPAILNRTDWAFISVDGSGPTNQLNILHVPFADDNPSNFVNAVNAFLNDHAEIGLVAVGSQNGQGYDGIEQVSGSIPVIMFYVEGGWQAAEQHLAMLNHVRQGEYRWIRSGETVSRPIRPGCGSCGRR